MRFVATTCPEQLASQTILFEPARIGLPGGLLAPTCLVRTTKGTAYTSVTNVITNDILLYPRTGLSIVCSAQVVCLPVGVTEVMPTAVSVSSQAAAGAEPEPIYAVDLSALTEQEQMEVRAVLQKYKTVFSQHEGDLGCTNLISHEIPLLDNVPVRQRYRRIPPSEYEEVKMHIVLLNLNTPQLGQD